MLSNGRLAILLLLAATVVISRAAAGQSSNDSSAVPPPAGDLALGQGESPLLAELRQASSGALRTVPLDKAESLTLRMALDELSVLYGLVPTSTEAVILNQQEASTAEVWLVELDQSATPDSHLFLYYVPEDGSLYFLRVGTSEDFMTSARMWGSGRSELVMSRDGVSIAIGPSPQTFRLQFTGARLKRGPLTR